MATYNNDEDPNVTMWNRQNETETTNQQETLQRFTPGEWVIEKRNGKIFIEAIGKDGEETTAVEICQLYGNEPIDEKDAALIASAPTLLKENNDLKIENNRLMAVFKEQREARQKAEEQVKLLREALFNLHEETCEIEDYGVKLSNGKIADIVQANKEAIEALNQTK